MIKDEFLYPKIVGICGKSGSGKSTIADHLGRKIDNIYCEAFATIIRSISALAFNITYDNFQSPGLKNIEDDYWKVSPRQIMQFVGTELFRNKLKDLLGERAENFWIEQLDITIKDHIEVGHYLPSDIVLITDVRFQNEVDYIRSLNGKIIHLTRPGLSDTVGILNHESEKLSLNFAGVPTYYVKNDGTLDQFLDKSETILDFINETFFKINP